VLEGGLPLWVSEGYKLEETSASDDELEAPLQAAQHPPTNVHYSAHLQAGSLPSTACTESHLRQGPNTCSCCCGSLKKAMQHAFQYDCAALLVIQIDHFAIATQPAETAAAVTQNIDLQEGQRCFIC